MCCFWTWRLGSIMPGNGPALGSGPDMCDILHTPVMLGIPQGLTKPMESPSHCLQPASGQLRCLPRFMKCNGQDLTCCAHAPAMPRESEYREVVGYGWGLALWPAE